MNRDSHDEWRELNDELVRPFSDPIWVYESCATEPLCHVIVVRSERWKIGNA